MRYTFAVLVKNKHGVLARIAGLFSARGYNIASLTVSETMNPSVSYMTIVVEAGDKQILEQIKKQLNRLIDVIKVTDFTRCRHVDRELVLIKISYAAKNESKIKRMLDKHSARIVKRAEDTAIIEIADDQEKIKQLISDLKKTRMIKDLARTGKIAMVY